MNLAETIIPQNYINKINEAKYDWDKEEVKYFYEILLTATSKFLAKAKKVDSAVAIKFTDEGGNFLMGAQVEAHVNEDEKDKPGNWSYVMTFKEEDITAERVFGLSDSEFAAMIESVSYDLRRYMFNQPSAKTILMRACVSVLIDYLDKNTTVESPTEVELEGFFQAAARIEEQVKEMSMTPADVMKTLIKNDADLQK